jgi:hypothetical protein
VRAKVFGIAGVLLTIGLSGRALACSQCMCGTPFPADVLGGAVPARFSYGIEERYLSKSNALDEGSGAEQEREHRIAGFGLWRPFNAFAVLARLPFNAKKITSTPTGGVSTTERSFGVGDAELLAMIGLYRTAGPRPLSFGVVAGGALPTGSNGARGDDGERLDSHLQPGTGAWSGTLGLNAALGGDAVVWDASVLGRASTTSAHGYRYGRALLYNAGLITKESHGLRLLAQVNGRVAAKDRLEDGTIGQNTGGSVTYLSPGLRWTTGLGLGLEGAVQIPVAESLFGVQDEHTTARLTLTLAR